MWLGLLSWALINSSSAVEASQIWLVEVSHLGCPNAELRPSSALPHGAHRA